MLETAKKYLLAFPQGRQAKIFDLLEKGQCFEIIEEEKQPVSPGEALQDLEQASYLLSSLQFVLNFLEPLSQKPSFLTRLKGQRIVLQKGETAIGNKEKFMPLVERVIAIEKSLEQVKKENQTISAQLKQLADFEGLAFKPRETEETAFLLAAVQEKDSQVMIDFCLKNDIFQKKASQESKRLVFLLIFLKKDKAKAVNFIKEIKGDLLDFDFDKEPALVKKELGQKIIENENKEGALKKELIQLARKTNHLKVFHDLLLMEKNRLEIKAKALKDGLLNYVLFWSLAGPKEILEKKLKKLCPQCLIMELGLNKDEEPPVVLTNHQILRPFEYVTEIFGLPKRDELDPTPYLSLFFILFFGICITDAGYGLLLALFTGLAMIFLKEKVAGNKLIKLLFYGGISTFLVGVLFGSYFGASPSALGLPFLKVFKLIDPIEDTVLFMGLAFFLGYLQLILAQIVRMISGKKNRKSELFDSGLAWLLVYLSGGVLLLSVKLAYLQTIGLFALMGSGLLLLVAESRGVAIYLKPLAGGVKILQGLIGAMSDILSYSRLMALGLATAVIALIVNQIAGLFSGIIPLVGWLLGGLILIGGHLFNLGINALSGFIHSGRLQFVEFFPKFLEGGGRRFKPVKSDLKYTKVEE